MQGVEGGEIGLRIDGLGGGSVGGRGVELSRGGGGGEMGWGGGGGGSGGCESMDSAGGV